MCNVDLFRELNRNGSFASMFPALQKIKKNKNKNLMPHLHLQNLLMRNWEFFLSGLTVVFYQSFSYSL